MRYVYVVLAVALVAYTAATFWIGGFDPMELRSVPAAAEGKAAR